MWNITRPPIVGIVLLVISIFLHFYFPIAKIIPYPMNLTGILLSFLGLLITIWGALTFQKTDTPRIPHDGKPKKIVVSGPYKFTRNPMYLGMVIFLLGTAIFMGSIIAFLSPVLFFMFINFSFIPYEEKLLTKIFGKEYENYKRKVRRWI